MTNKFLWLSLLWLDIGLFILSLTFTNYWLNLVVILLALLIYKQGNSALFSLYNTKMSEKRTQEVMLKEATQKIVSSGRLFRGGKKNE